jgi:hypothetical protein
MWIQQDARTSSSTFRLASQLAPTAWSTHSGIQDVFPIVNHFTCIVDRMDAGREHNKKNRLITADVLGITAGVLGITAHVLGVTADVLGVTADVLGLRLFMRAWESVLHRRMAIVLL